MKKFLTIQEVADTKTRSSLAKIYRLVHKRQIPFIKQGHQLLFLEEEIDQWLLSQRVQVEISFNH